MAKKKRVKTGGRDIKPGQVLNPKGIGATPLDIREAKQFNKHELARVINEYFYMTVDEIKDRLENPNTPAIEIIVGTGVVKAGMGDYLWFSLILERIVGRVPLKESTDLGDNPMLGHIQKLARSSSLTRKEIDQLIKNRDVIAAEYEVKTKPKAKKKTKAKAKTKKKGAKKCVKK